MPIFDKVNGVYHKANKSYSRVNGVWRQDKKIYDRVNGVWRESYSSFPDVINVECTGKFNVDEKDSKEKYKYIKEFIGEVQMGSDGIYPLVSLTVHNTENDGSNSAYAKIIFSDPIHVESGQSLIHFKHICFWYNHNEDFSSASSAYIKTNLGIFDMKDVTLTSPVEHEFIKDDFDWASTNSGELGYIEFYINLSYQKLGYNSEHCHLDLNATIDKICGESVANMSIGTYKKIYE